MRTTMGTTTASTGVEWKFESVSASCLGKWTEDTEDEDKGFNVIGAMVDFVNKFVRMPKVVK